MGFLDGKRILVTGLLSNRSIAWGIAKAARREGAELALTYQNDRFRERVQEMADELGSSLIFPCDVSSDEQIDALARDLRSKWTSLHGLVHAIAYSPREAIAGDFLEGFSREAFRVAHEISAYSFPALAKAFQPVMAAGGSMLTLSYIGSVRAMPHYNTMGLAKASLEASVRYLAGSLGPRGGVRVNAISAGPIKTLAAAGIADFTKIFKHVQQNSPLRRNVTIDDVGNTAAFLLSDLAAGITGQILYVDAGYNNAVGGLEAEHGPPGPA